jgi:hypothetical protein
MYRYLLIRPLVVRIVSRVQGITVRRKAFPGEFQADWTSTHEERGAGQWKPDTHRTRESTCRKFNIALNYKEMGQYQDDLLDTLTLQLKERLGIDLSQYTILGLYDSPDDHAAVF